jgi:hypothetical protein
MPKVTIEFNLPDEQSEFEEINNAGKYYSVLWDLDQFLRNKTKYATDEVSKEEVNACYALRDELWRLLGEYNLDLNK